MRLVLQYQSNLNPEQMSLLRGRRYNRQKGQGKRNDLTFTHNEDKLTTSEKLAAQYGVSRATIERDAQFATAIEEIEPYMPEITQRIMDGSGSVENNGLHRLVLSIVVVRSVKSLRCSPLHNAARGVLCV
jgi:molybdenum cofactor biosynthesis enzyme MoaA